jgi:hypothetical protein
MKINEILLIETAEDIKLLINLAGFDIDEIANKSQQIQQQFLRNPADPGFAEGMRHYLVELNLLLIKISEMPNWQEWSNTADGVAVQQELDKLYNNNLEFMKKYRQ